MPGFQGVRFSGPERVSSNKKEAQCDAFHGAVRSRTVGNNPCLAHFQEAVNRLEGKVNSVEESAGSVVFKVVISTPRPHRPAICDGSERN